MCVLSLPLSGSGKLLLDIGGTDIGSPLETDDRFSVLLAPLDALVKAAAAVVFPEGKYIKVDFLQSFHADSLVNNDFVNRAQGFENFDTLFCRIEDMGVRLELGL